MNPDDSQLPRESFAIGVALQELKNALILNTLGVQLHLISSFFGDGIDLEIAKQLWNVELALTNILASFHQVVTETAESVSQQNKDD